MERLAVMGKRIRSVETFDADVVRDIYAPFVLDSATSFEVSLPDAAEMKKRIRDLRDQYPWLVFEEDGKVLAYAYASPHRTRHAYQWSVEVSIYVHSVAHRCGIGRALYTALFEVLRRQGYVNAYAGITLPNPASVQLHESMGFTAVGVFNRIGFKFGKWHDTAWLQLRLIEASASVPDPIPVHRFLDEDSILSMFEGCARSVRLH
jgi:phosphinothricin acetyltransferase